MSYRTVQGDTWDLISFKNYGSSAMTDTLIAVNPMYAKTAIFSAGVKINLPTVPVIVSSSLPPWKRGGMRV